MFNKYQTLQNLYKILLFAFALIFLLFNIIPIYWIGLSAVTPQGMLFVDKYRYLPLHLTLDNFKRVFDTLPYGKYFYNSIIVSTVSTVLATFLSLIASYAFARLRFFAKDFIFWFFLASMMLPPMSTVIPIFQLFRNMGLLNTLTGLIIIYSSNFLPFTIWVTTSFIRQVPVELEEAATIDGASFWQMFFRILLPLLTPILASMFIINFISAWNELIWPLVLSLKADAKLLTNALTEAATVEAMMTPWENVSAMSVMMIVPVVIIVLIFQRQIMAGLTAGAFK